MCQKTSCLVRNIHTFENWRESRVSNGASAISVFFCFWIWMLRSKPSASQWSCPSKFQFIRPASHRFGEARDKTNTHTHWHAVASKDYYVWNEYVHICFANLIIKEVYDMDFWNFADKVFVKSNDFFSFVVKKMCFVWIPLKNESTISWKFNISFILIFLIIVFLVIKIQPTQI